ncbi:hypothetical protein [Anoxynatronum sibiricum]|uniref:Uncharacterized protein n=1 Tax=Anoxynatronum sibiricum TaxID=210623 RepID=A0ABU9VSM2_9CLOT
MEQKLLQLNEKLASDSTLALQILEKETAEEVQALLSQVSLEFTTVEITELRGLMVKVTELGEEALADVSYKESFLQTLELINVSNIETPVGQFW